MQTIFVQIKCELGQSYRVAEELVEIDGVSEVYSISGPYDLLVKCYVADDGDVGHFVNNQVQSVPGIRDTLTIITFNAFGYCSGPGAKSSCVMTASFLILMEL